METIDNIEVIARGVCVKDDKVLLCHTKGAHNTYLPGGHVDLGEYSRDALKREIVEELGCDSQVQAFLGVIENNFVQNGEARSEINLVFELDIPDLDPALPAESKEDYIEFVWQDMKDLQSAAIEPAVLCKLLPDWLDQGGVDRWASAF
jgi:8-oxo-dGTP diphosphatase